MSISAEAFFQAADEAIHRLKATQLPQIRKGGELLAEAVMSGGVIQVFGTGHSRAFAMEMAGRAGGLVPANAITEDVLFLNGIYPVEERKNPYLEREPQIAHQILAQYDIRPEDAFVIASNSGRNGSTVEMAAEVKRRGHKLVVITSMAHTSRVSSRHPSGRRLHEFADVVIDNCAPLGDALLEVEGHPLRVCAVSSITGALIAQGLTAEVVRRLLAAGQVPPVYISANVDGADAHNEALRARYGNRI
ncbi:putative phosphosugar-binding protein [Symbiobacterium terraclitae]|uniref:Phosphosugar-binding protein n=1 Tax=Symbiobacterium terraclitae TaxID=557451 RepID=A0ABS4JSE8_9FIRM|nr:SIS domain-containing protein [Symbiobacterium terraclitae]MBP2018440.1 putative phosphosugar-binding protein [Symbiobacterium terraclitae]